MVFGLVVKEIPFLFLMTLSVLPQTRAAEMERMIASLGYGRIVGFVHAVLPSLYRQLRLPVLAVLAFSTSVVDVALILGPTTPAPLAVRVIDWQHDPDLSRHFVAAAGAVLQVGVTVAHFSLACRGAGRRGHLPAARALRLACAPRRLASPHRQSRDGAFGGDRARRPRPARALVGRRRLALPPAASARADAFHLDAALAGVSAWRSRDTLALAGVSSLAATALALGALESAARAGLRGPGQALRALYVPLIAPQVAFLFGLQILFAFAGIDGTFVAVALVHLVFVFPYVLLSLSDPWSAWDPRYGLAIRALGHGPNAVFWRVRLPMLARPVLVAAALGFAVSVALYLPTLLIGGGRWPTVTTEAVALASGGDPRLIGATALMQALLPFLGFAIAAIVPALPLPQPARHAGLRMSGDGCTAGSCSATSRSTSTASAWCGSTPASGPAKC